MQHDTTPTTPENFATKTGIVKEAASFAEAYNIDKNTDELEGLIKATNAKLEEFRGQEEGSDAIIETDLGQIKTTLGEIAAKLDTANGHLATIAQNTA